MTTTLPTGLEYKTTGAVPPASLRQRKDLGANTGEWGSEYPEEHGVRNAIVAVTGVRDEVGDIIVPGAFKRTLAKLEPKMCLGHDWNRFIGDPIAYEELMPGDPRLPKKDRLGRPWNPKAGALCTRNRYLLDTPDGNKAYAEVQFQGAKAAFSIGYVAIEEKTWKAVDPDSGLLTRFLGDVDLYEYGPVLHGAHPMAGVIGSKSVRPPLEEKVIRLVRDSAFWGLPVGTRIFAGMKPNGPKARRLQAANKPVSENAGAVELDPNRPVEIKPTAKGKMRAGRDGALLWDMVDEVQGMFDDERDPFDPIEFEVDDTNSINKGDPFNPLDVLIANAMTPADLEEYLQQGEWDSVRVGDAEERRPEIDAFIGNVVAAYRERYDRELVKQNADKATEEIPRERGDDPEADAEDDAASAGREDLKLQDGRSLVAVDPGDDEKQAFELTGESGATLRVFEQVKPGSPGRPWVYDVVSPDGTRQESFDNFSSLTQAIASAETELAAAEGREAPSADSAVPGTGVAEPPASEVDAPAAEALQQPAEAEVPAAPAAPVAAAPTPAPPAAAAPTPAPPSTRPPGPATGRAIAMEDGRTLQSVEPEDGEAQAFELSEGGATLRVFEDAQPADPNRRWGFRVTSADGTVTEGPQSYRSSGSALVLAEDQFAAAGSGEAPGAVDALVDDVSGTRLENAIAAGDLAPGDRYISLSNEPVTVTNVSTSNGIVNVRAEGPRGPMVERYAPTLELPRAPEETDGTVTPDGGTVDEAEAYVTTGNMNAPEDFTDAQLQAEVDAAKALKAELIKRRVPANSAQLADAKMRVSVFETEQRKRTQGTSTGPYNAGAEPAAAPGTEVPPAQEGPATGRGAALINGQPPTAKLQALLGQAVQGPDGWTVRGHENILYPLVRAKLGERTPDTRGVVLNEQGAQAMAQYLPGGNASPEAAPSTEVVPDDAPDPSIVDPNGGAPIPDGLATATTPEQALTDGPTAAAIAENAVRITADQVAEADEVGDASFGIVEAPDGEFEADPDVADRQDRLAALLIQDEAGTLDLSSRGEEELRATRADLVTEIRLQDHLATRVRRDPAKTSAQREQAAEDDVVAETDAAVLPEPEEDTGPKPRPGVAGAAEDLADALESGDDERIAAARARLDSSLNRSRSDSEQVQALRVLLSGETEFTAEDLRAASAAIKAEQRAKRNENAKSRRLVRRLERERLRSLLGTVEATMRNRGLSYDAAPESAPQNRLDRLVNGPVVKPAPTWKTTTTEESWSGSSYQRSTLGGSGYAASFTEYPNQPVAYQWAVITEDGNTISSGSGHAVDADAARMAVEVALDVQHNLGLLPADAQPPTGNLPTESSATPSADVDAAVDVMRQRIADGRALNPITGKPDPFAEGARLLPVTGQVFDNPEAIRLYLQSPEGPTSSFTNAVRWDTAVMTPGGAFVVVDDLAGKPLVLHAASGAHFDPLGRDKFNRADLLRFATIAESLPDRDGIAIDWSLGKQDLAKNMKERSFQSDNDGFAGVQTGATTLLAAEKIRGGQWSSPLIKGSLTLSSGGATGAGYHATNRSQIPNLVDLQRAITSKLGGSWGKKPTGPNKKTLEVMEGAEVLDTLGAPDASVVLLRRHAAELRELHGADADTKGANLLDALADTYLSVYSPQKAPGDRILSVRPGERLHIAAPAADAEADDAPVRTYRVLAALRSGGKYSSDSVTNVVDESTGKHAYLKVDNSKVWVTDDPDSTPYSARTMTDAIVENRATGRFLVTDPGETPPATSGELVERARASANAIPADVLDAAAEALPESKPERAARSAATPPGTRAPRRGSAAAPRRRAQVPAEPAQVRNEDALAVAEGKGVSAVLGIPFQITDGPVSPGYTSLDKVREYLVSLDDNGKDAKLASSARASIDNIDKGFVTLSPGGHFLVAKDGYVTHINSTYIAWPSTQGARDDMMSANITGRGSNQPMGQRIADALERGSWNGTRMDWSGKAEKMQKNMRAIFAANQADPTVTASRSAYLTGVLSTAKPKPTDLAMVAGMLGSVEDLPMPNPEGMTGARNKARELQGSYEILSGRKAGPGRIDHDFAADSKAGATLAKRVAVEMELAGPLGRVMPLAAVRRLTALADELDGQTITGVASRVDEGQSAPERRDFSPSEALRDVASKITDAFDETKLSPSGSLLRSGWTGNIVLTGEPVVRTPDRFNDRFEAEKRVTQAVKGGLRVYVDEDGRRHATFGEVDVMDDPTDRGQFRRTGGTVDIGLNGELVVEYSEESEARLGQRTLKRVEIKLPAGTWKFESEATPEPSPNAEPEPTADAPEIVYPPDEQRVRDAVARLTKRPGAWVNFTRLRKELSDVPRDELDQTLFNMMSQDDVFLIPEANQKVLSEEDRAAAVYIGGEDKHLISIYSNPESEEEPAAEETVTVDADAAMADAFGPDDEAGVVDPYEPI